MTAWLLASALGLATLSLAAVLLWTRRRERQANAQRETLQRELSSLRETLAAERDAQQRASKESDRLAALVDHVPRPVWARNTQGRLTYCNAAYAAALEAERERVIADNLALVETPDRASVQSLVEQALSGDAAQSKRFHIVTDGQRRYWELTEVPLATGELIGYARDLTEWEETDNNLRRHLEAQQSVLESIGIGIAILDSDMHLSFFNRAYAAIWQFDEEFLSEGPHVSQMLEWLREHQRLPEQVNFSAWRKQRVRKLEMLVESEEEAHHLPSGRTLRATLHPHPFGGVVQVYEDVTDRLELERTYNTLLAVQRATLDSLHEGVAVYGPDGRLRLSNPAFARIWNLPLPWLDEQPHVREMVLHCRGFFDVSDEAWPGLMEKIVTVTTEAQTRAGRMERSDGSVIEWRQTPLPDGNCVLGYVDVTDSVHAKQALVERNEALETADRLKSEFIANISYELRTPLNAIIGFAEMLQQNYDGELNERQQEYAGAIINSSHQLMALINDILDLASIEAGYMEIETGEVDLCQLVTSVEKLWRDRARTRNLALTVSCPNGIGTLQGDERRISQVLFNLLSNAFRFTPDRGAIEVAVERKPDGVILTVQDNGIGIPDDERAGILGREDYGRFSRTQRRRTGAGMGLVLARSLIELHGGHLELESAPQKGTTARCHLPSTLPAPQR